MKEAIVKLISLKSILTLALNFGMLMLLSGAWNPTSEILALFSTTYGAVMTYYFTRKQE